MENAQENTCARVSFSIKLHASGCNFIQKVTLTLLFSCEFCQIFQNIPFTQHLQSFFYYAPKIFPETNISDRAYQGVANVSFSENFALVLNEWSLPIELLYVDGEQAFSPNSSYSRMTNGTKNVRRYSNSATKLYVHCRRPSMQIYHYVCFCKVRQLQISRSLLMQKLWRMNL